MHRPPLRLVQNGSLKEGAAARRQRETRAPDWPNEMHIGFSTNQLLSREMPRMHAALVELCNAMRNCRWRNADLGYRGIGVVRRWPLAVWKALADLHVPYKCALCWNWQHTRIVRNERMRGKKQISSHTYQQINKLRN